MKKILTVLLVLTLSVAGLLAVADDFTEINSSIKLTASIAKQVPTFEFIGSIDDFASSVTATNPAVQLKTGMNPSEQDIVASFRLKQTNLSRHNGNLTVTVTGTEFINDEKSTIKSGLPTVENKTKMANTGALALTGDKAENNVYSVKLNYSENKPQDKIDDIFTLSYTWARTPSLPAGNYSAVVSINIQTGV